MTLPVLSLLKQGHEVYVLTDVAGDVDESSHQMAIQRMVQAGAVPVTWLAVMLEWQGGQIARLPGRSGRLRFNTAGRGGLELRMRER